METFSTSHVASTIDHAVLKPDQTAADLHENAILCMKYKVTSMCARPCDIKLAADLLKGSPVKTSCVLSFPHGHDTIASKKFQASKRFQMVFRKLIWS